MTILKPIRVSLSLSSSPLCLLYHSVTVPASRCHFSACLTGTEHGTIVTEHKGQSTQALGCGCSWSMILVQSAQGCSGERGAGT